MPFCFWKEDIMVRKSLLWLLVCEKNYPLYYIGALWKLFYIFWKIFRSYTGKYKLMSIFIQAQLWVSLSAFVFVFVFVYQRQTKQWISTCTARHMIALLLNFQRNHTIIALDCELPVLNIKSKSATNCRQSENKSELSKFTTVWFGAHLEFPRSRRLALPQNKNCKIHKHNRNYFWKIKSRSISWPHCISF